MAGTRSQYIRARVQRLAGDPAGMGIANEGLVYECLNRVQQRIAEEAGADQAKETITFVAGTELYNLPDGMVGVNVIVPPGTTPLQKLTMSDVERIKRVGSSSSSTSDDPLYYYFWNDQVGFMTASGGAPSAVATVTVYGWKGIKDTAPDGMSNTVDPIVHKRWDGCLCYGALAEIAPSDKTITIYESEFRRVKSTENAYRMLSHEIPVETQYD